jgi:maltooligosyltrehalose synthase
LFVTARGLRFRRENAGLFAGAYVPLTTSGERAAHVIAFIRSGGGKQALFITPRFACPAVREFPTVRESVGASAGWPAHRWWEATTISLPTDSPTRWRHLLTGREVEARRDKSGEWDLLASEVLQSFPVAIFEAT